LGAALALAGRGHQVIATTHTQAAATRLGALAAKENLDLQSWVLDVTSESDREKILGLELDVLINNAGMGETGSLAEIPSSKIRANFEVNLFGPLELTRLALQNMVKKDRGTVIFVSSLLGRISAPFFGPYSMTKLALSGAGEMLRGELGQISSGVQVSLVEPGAYHTGFNQKMMAKKFLQMDMSSYFFGLKEKLRRAEEKRFGFMEVKDSGSLVAKIVEAAEAKRPKLRYQAPWWQSWAVRLARIGGR